MGIAMSGDVRMRRLRAQANRVVVDWTDGSRLSDSNLSSSDDVAHAACAVCSESFGDLLPLSFIICHNSGPSRIKHCNHDPNETQSAPNRTRTRHSEEIDDAR